MKKFIENHLAMTLSLFLVAGSLILGSWVAHTNQRDVESRITARIAAQETLMASLADITDRNGADEIIETIVEDCPRRAEYEELLNSLETLSKKDLIAAQNLYESCGSFYAERKALMVAKLDREYQIYSEYIELLTELQENSESFSNAKKWEELVTYEKTRSTLLNEQEVIQSKIISSLISGSTVQSKDIVQLVHDAGEIGELLGVHDFKIDELREGLSE